MPASAESPARAATRVEESVSRADARSRPGSARPATSQIRNFWPWSPWVSSASAMVTCLEWPPLISVATRMPLRTSAARKTHRTAASSGTVMNRSSTEYAAPPATTAWVRSTGRSRGSCQRSRPSHCPNNNAVYPAVPRARTTVGTTRTGSTPPAPARPATHQAARVAAKPARTYAPLTSHDDKLPLVIR